MVSGTIAYEKFFFLLPACRPGVCAAVAWNLNPDCGFLLRAWQIIRLATA
jgi:hypothetical protein